MRTSCESGRPSGIDRSAFTTRFSTTCPSRRSSPRTSGTRSSCVAIRARQRDSARTIGRIDSTTRQRSTGPSGASARRASRSSSETTRRTRSTPSRLSPSTSSKVAGSVVRQVRAIWFRLLDTNAIGSLISWARPAASVPTVAIRAPWASRQVALAQAPRALVHLRLERLRARLEPGVGLDEAAHQHAR